MEIKDIKQSFFMYRNGILADTLRKAGDTHGIIFGLNLPQIVDIAKSIGKDKSLAEELWENKTCRESRLLAPMIYPVDELTEDVSKSWIENIENEEVSDILCNKLLRHTKFAAKLCRLYFSSEIDLIRYTAFRLALNLLSFGNAEEYKDEFFNMAEKELKRDCKITRSVVKGILEE